MCIGLIALQCQHLRVVRLLELAEVLEVGFASLIDQVQLLVLHLLVHLAHLFFLKLMSALTILLGLKIKQVVILGYHFYPLVFKFSLLLGLLTLEDNVSKVILLIARTILLQLLGPVLLLQREAIVMLDFLFHLVPLCFLFLYLRLLHSLLVIKQALIVDRVLLPQRMFARMMGVYLAIQLVAVQLLS